MELLSSKDFFTALKVRRESLGLSIYRLAKLTGIKEQQLTAYERGAQSSLRLESVLKLCEVLNMTLELKFKTDV